METLFCISRLPEPLKPDDEFHDNVQSLLAVGEGVWGDLLLALGEIVRWPLVGAPFQLSGVSEAGSEPCPVLSTAPCIHNQLPSKPRLQFSHSISLPPSGLSTSWESPSSTQGSLSWSLNTSTRSASTLTTTTIFAGPTDRHGRTRLLVISHSQPNHKSILYVRCVTTILLIHHVQLPFVTTAYIALPTVARSLTVCGNLALIPHRSIWRLTLNSNTDRLNLRFSSTNTKQSTPSTTGPF